MSNIPALSIMNALDAARDAHAQPPRVAEAGAARTGSPQDGFSTLLDAARAPAAIQTASPAAFQTTLRPGVLGSGNGLGDQVLDGLEKLGRSIGNFDAMGSAPPRTTPAMMSVTSAPKAATGDPLSSLHDMWQSGLQQQKQLYSTVFEFELVEESSQSMMKSLKSLLTQGGG